MVKTDLKRLQNRRRLSIACATLLASITLIPIPVLSPGALARPLLWLFVLALGAIFGFGLHRLLIGPVLFSARSRALRNLARFMPVRLNIIPAPVFRFHSARKSKRVVIFQYLWSGWRRVHRDQQFESIAAAQTFLNDWGARMMGYVGPEFTNDDLLTVEVDTHSKPLSVQLRQDTPHAIAERKKGTRSLALTRLCYILASPLAIPVVIYLALPVAQVFDASGLTQPLVLIAGTWAIAVILAWSMAPNTIRKRWWRDVTHGRRNVRYRVTRYPGGGHYWIEVFSANEWRLKQHLTAQTLLDVEHLLARDVRALNKVIDRNRALVAEQQARAQLEQPFSVSVKPREYRPYAAQVEYQESP